MKIINWHGQRQDLLSLLWIYLTVNYIYCDVFTLHLSDYLEAFLAGDVGGMKITEEFLLIFAVIMQIPMIMIVLSRVLIFPVNKVVNLVAGVITTSVQALSLTEGGTAHYLLFSFFEISTGLIIIYLAASWRSTNIDQSTGGNLP